MDTKDPNNTIRDYGFHGEDIVIEDDHYMMKGLSGLPKDILQADGDWRPFIPVYEPQFIGTFDTNGCSTFGTLNALEVLMKKIFGGSYDYAERYQYIRAGVNLNGGDPHKVAESIRKDGVIPQESLPLMPTYEEFTKPNPMTAEFLLQGSEWLMTHAYLHDWVFVNNPSKKDRVNLLKEALKYSPVALSVTAWMQDDNGLFIDNGQPNTHWVCCVALEQQPDGEYCPIIIDSYDLIMNGVSTMYTKKLHPDHHIEYAKRYSVTPITKPVMTDEKKNLFLDILKDILRSFGILAKEAATLPPSPAPVPPVTPEPPKPVQPIKVSLDSFCLAIRDFEGKPGDLNYRNNNPGNCRCSKVGYKDIYGAVKCVNNFAVFPTKEQGMLYLHNLIKEKIAQHPEWTIYEYFALFHAPSIDHNDPIQYANAVARQCGVPVSTQIKNIV